MLGRVEVEARDRRVGEGLLGQLVVVEIVHGLAPLAVDTQCGACGALWTVFIKRTRSSGSCGRARAAQAARCRRPGLRWKRALFYLPTATNLPCALPPWPRWPARRSSRERASIRRPWRRERGWRGSRPGWSCARPRRGSRDPGAPPSHTARAPRRSGPATRAPRPARTPAPTAPRRIDRVTPARAGNARWRRR